MKDRIEIKDDRYYALKAVKELYTASMRPLFEKHAANKKFFTQKEFESIKGQIFIITAAKDKVDNLINKIP